MFSVILRLCVVDFLRNELLVMAVMLFAVSTSLCSFYARKQLLLSARFSHRNSVCLSVCPSVTRIDQSEVVQARITKFSPSAAGKAVVLGAVKIFHKFERGHPERGH